MKRQARKKRITVAKIERVHVFGIVVAVTVLVVGAVTVLSRQTARVTESKNQANTSLPAAKPDKNDASVRVVGQEPAMISQKEDIQPLTPQEAEKMAAELKPMLNQSTEGLVQVQHPDGSVSMDLDDRFQSVTVARVNKDGTVTQSCVDNPRAAGAFFGIDPKLIENAPDQTPRARHKVNKNQ